MISSSVAGTGAVASVWSRRTIARWQKQSHEFSDEFVGRHSGQSAFQKPSRRVIVGGDACKVEIRRVVGLESAKEFVAAPKNVETTGLPGAQTQAAQIADPPGRAVDEAPANRAKARAYDTFPPRGRQWFVWFAPAGRRRQTSWVRVQRTPRFGRPSGCHETNGGCPRRQPWRRGRSAARPVEAGINSRSRTVLAMIHLQAGSGHAG